MFCSWKTGPNAPCGCAFRLRSPIHELLNHLCCLGEGTLILRRPGLSLAKATPFGLHISERASGWRMLKDAISGLETDIAPAQEAYLLREATDSCPLFAMGPVGKPIEFTVRLTGHTWQSPALQRMIQRFNGVSLDCLESRRLGAGAWLDEWERPVPTPSAIAIAIDHPSRPSLALEIATHGEPRSISIAAIPVVSDLENFAVSLSRHPAQPLTSEHYDSWRARHLILPTACPCCAEAAEKRRQNPESSPLAAIFSNAINESLTLHCRLNSKTFAFSQSFVPGNLLMSSGHIGLTGDDGGAMLEIDPGLCHSFTLHRRPLDAEPMTILRIFNSLGIPEVTIEAPGYEPYDEWLRLSRL